MAEYLSRRTRLEPQQPQGIQLHQGGESLLNYCQRTGKVASIEAQRANFSADELEHAEQIREAMRTGNWLPGCTIPKKLLPLFPHCCQLVPAGLHGQNSSAVAAIGMQMAAQRAAGVTHHVQPHPRRDMTHDHAEHQNPQMSYRLRQAHELLGEYGHTIPYSEAALHEAMDRLDVHSTSERLALMVEAHGLGIVAKSKGHGPILVRQHERRRPGVRQEGLTLQAADAYGPCYDGTSIEVGSGLDLL